MLTEPEVIQRAARPYVAMRADVTMQTLGTVLPPLHGRVFEWLGQQRTEPAGPAFWKYNVIDMDRSLEVEVGVPVAAEVGGDEQVLAGILPAGRYASLRYTGHPDGLVGATGFLLEWARQRHLTWDLSHGPDGEHWGARLEIYETDPIVHPDMSLWTTQLAFRLSD
jgi:effector-binding domain-containing protein